MQEQPVGNIRAKIVWRGVENPSYAPDHDGDRTNPRHTAAMINIRESAVETLYARGALNTTQKRSADRFRAIYEAMGGAGAGAIDYAREHVDGGKSRDPIPDRMIHAGKELAGCLDLLGPRLFRVVMLVCGEGHALDEFCSTKREKNTAADNLRAALDDLAAEWGYVRVGRK